MDCSRAWSISWEKRPVLDGRNIEGSSPGLGGSIPIIRVNPPNGIALSPYFVSPRARPEGRAEPEHELGDLDAKLLGPEEVAILVERDGDADAEGDEQNAEEVHH